LNGLILGYLKPLRASANSADPIVSEQDIKTLFSDIEIIYSVSVQLEKELSPLVAKFAASTMLAKTLAKIVSSLLHHQPHHKQKNKIPNPYNFFFLVDVHESLFALCYELQQIATAQTRPHASQSPLRRLHEGTIECLLIFLLFMHYYRI
jgi:hypothetical protein